MNSLVCYESSDDELESDSPDSGTGNAVIVDEGRARPTEHENAIVKAR